MLLSAVIAIKSVQCEDDAADACLALIGSMALWRARRQAVTTVAVSRYM